MNLPTKITVARIALIPVMVVFYFINFGNGLNLVCAAIVYAIAAFTDFLDGHIARSRNMVTDLGKFLDPIADKVLVVVALFLIVESRVMPEAVGSVLCGLIIAREFIISALRQIAATKNSVLAADKLGKIKTILTNFSLPFLIASPIDKSNILYYIGFVLFVLATIMTVVSGGNYIFKNRKLFVG
jgi:CDP-diacylglycerol--glycerol-3-phosphate 3-phosphatidyltransferase